MLITKEEAAWMAGLFDGEGCVRFKFARGYVGFSLALGMTHKETIDRLCELIEREGFTYTLSTQDLPSGKEMYIWQVARRTTVVYLAKMLVEFSTTKKQELLSVIEAATMVDGGDHNGAARYMKRCIPPRQTRTVKGEAICL